MSFHALKKLTVVLALMMMLLAGCNMKQNADIQTNTPVVIEDLKYNEVMKEEKTDIVEFNFTFPQVQNPKENPFIESINNSYTKALEEQKVRATTENLATAKENYLFSKENADASFIMNGYQINYSVTTNDGKYLSVFQMFSEFAGGAHPFTYFKAQNFDLIEEKSIKLSELFGLSEEETKKNVLEQVFETIKAQEANEGIIYYESYKTDCDTAYNPEHFYMKDGKIIFFYQAYDIAPYAAGLREFEIKVDKGN